MAAGQMGGWTDGWINGKMDGWVDEWMGCSSTGCSESHFGEGRTGLFLPAPLHPSLSPGRGSPALGPPPSHGPNCPVGAGKGFPPGAASPPLPFPAPHPCLGTSTQAWAASLESGDPNPPSCLGEVDPTISLGSVYSPGFPPGRFNFCLHVLAWRDAWAQGAPGTLWVSGVQGSPLSPGFCPRRAHLSPLGFTRGVSRRGQPRRWGCPHPPAGLGTSL